MDLKGKVAIVTGAGRGIGHAVTLALATEKCRILAVARSKNEIEQVVGNVKNSGGEALAISMDLTGPEAPELLVK